MMKQHKATEHRLNMVLPTKPRLRITRQVVHFIKEWRKYRGFSLEVLAKEAGLSPSMISQLETGKTTYTQTTLEALAKALDVEPWQLLVCSEPGELADLWRIIATLEQPDMKIVLREYADRRSKETRTPDAVKVGF